MSTSFSERKQRLDSFPGKIAGIILPKGKVRQNYASPHVTDIFGKEWKWCPFCNEWETLDKFSKCNRNWDSLQARCKQWDRHHYQTHKDKIIAYQHQYNTNNKKTIALRSKQYRLEHREELNLRSQQYRHEHKEEIRAQRQRHYQEHRGEIIARTSQYYEDNREQALIRTNKYYEDNKSEILKRNSLYLRKKRLSFIKGKTCVACGESCAIVLVWHHRDPNEKTMNVSAAIRRGGIPTATIQHEIEKCDVLCANCHMRIHNYCGNAAGYKPELYAEALKALRLLHDDGNW